MPSAWNVPFILAPTFWDFWALGLDLVRLVTATLHRAIFRLIFGAGLGFAIASIPADFWTFAWNLFSAHWTHLLAPIGWLLCLLLSIFGPSLIAPDPWDVLFKEHFRDTAPPRLTEIRGG
jgi:hypothetical protein